MAKYMFALWMIFLFVGALAVEKLHFPTPVYAILAVTLEFTFFGSIIYDAARST
jgi:hypothetical protein